VTSLLTCNYFRPINKECLSIRQYYFIERLRAVSAAHFDANTAILRQNGSKLIARQTLCIFFWNTLYYCNQRTSTLQACECESKNPPEVLWHFFPKLLGNFRLHFTHLLWVSIYARLQIFIQLSAILTKVCHIKRDHPVHTIMFRMFTIGRNACWHFLTFFPNSWEFWSKFYTRITCSYLR